MTRACGASRAANLPPSESDAGLGNTNVESRRRRTHVATQHMSAALSHRRWSVMYRRIRPQVRLDSHAAPDLRTSGYISLAVATSRRRVVPIDGVSDGRSNRSWEGSTPETPECQFVHAPLSHAHAG